MYSQIYQYSTRYSQWFPWVVKNRGDDKIDEEGRIDFTGWHNDTKAPAWMMPNEPVHIQVMAKLETYAQGSGSKALIDLQTGDANSIRIPHILAFLP